MDLQELKINKKVSFNYSSWSKKAHIITARTPPPPTQKKKKKKLPTQKYGETGKTLKEDHS